MTHPNKSFAHRNALYFFAHAGEMKPLVDAKAGCSSW